MSGQLRVFQIGLYRTVQFLFNAKNPINCISNLFCYAIRIYIALVVSICLFIVYFYIFYSFLIIILCISLLYIFANHFKFY